MKIVRNIKQLNQFVEENKLKEVFDQDIENEMTLVSYEKGEFICQNGMEMLNVFFLVEGEVKIYTTLENGKIYLLRIERPLSFYGDIELMNSLTFVANVEALISCMCISLPTALIKKKYLEHARFLKYMCLNLGHRLQTISLISTENLYLPLANKLAGYLLIHKEANSNLVCLRSNFTDVSDQLGVTYRHLSRTLKNFEEEGIISKKAKVITLLNIGKIQELAGVNNWGQVSIIHTNSNE